MKRKTAQSQAVFYPAKDKVTLEFPGQPGAGKSYDYRDYIVLKSSVFKMFPVHSNTQRQRFQIPPV